MDRKQHPKWNEFVKACCTSQSKAEYLLRGDPELLEARSSHVGETPLHWLAIENRLEAVQFLIDHGADINTRDDFETTPLIHAAMVGHVDMVRLLVQAGADANARNDLGDIALDAANKANKPEDVGEITDLLRSARAEWDNSGHAESTEKKRKSVPTDHTDEHR